MTPKITVYRAVFRPEGDEGYDRFYPPEHPPYPDITYVRFGNGEGEKATGFDSLATPPDNRLLARMHKCLPHVLFPDADYTLWIDGSLTPVTCPLEYVERFKGCDIATFDRRVRDCAYDEGEKMARKRRDDPAKIRDQLVRYHNEGFPRHYGLCATTAVWRRNCPQINRLNELWWEEIQRGCNRDQVSLNYCMWKLGGIPWGKFDGDWNNSPDFRWRGHYGDKNNNG